LARGEYRLCKNAGAVAPHNSERRDDAPVRSLVASKLRPTICCCVPCPGGECGEPVVHHARLGHTSVPIFTLPLDVSPVPERTASLAAIQMAGTMAGGLTYPLLVGYLLLHRPLNLE
jgi:hypothetical protein